MKKALIIMLIVLIVVLPTVVGVVLYFLPEDAALQQVSISGRFYDGDVVSFDFSRSKNVTLCNFFDALEENSIISYTDVDNLKYDKVFYADMVRGGEQSSMVLYLSGNGYSYYSDGEALHRISMMHAQTLLSSSYVISLFESVNTPTLTTHSGDVIIPSSRSFKYVLGDGITTQEGKGTPVASEAMTYYSSKTTIFNFSKKPDICSVKAYVGGSLLYDGPLYEFNSSSLPSGDAVRFEIDATWVKGDESSKFFGTARYVFDIVYAPAPSFKLTSLSCDAGDMVAIKASNVRDASRISISAPDGIGESVRFFERGGNYYALIPVDVDLKSGKYKLKVSCGETVSTFELAVEARSRDASSKVYEVASPITDEQLSEMYGKLSEIGSICSDDSSVAGKTFINYELAYADDFQLTLGYGRIRTFSDGEALDMIGIEFSAVEGVSIPVINDGVVCAVGEDPILGRYVVVDHGCGLKSWYCNVSEVKVVLGSRIARGSAVALTGSSACYGQSGFYLITTVLGTPVSPYSVYENGFTLFN